MKFRKEMEHKTNTEIKATLEPTEEGGKKRHCYNLMQVMLRRGLTKAVNGSGQNWKPMFPEEKF